MPLQNGTFQSNGPFNKRFVPYSSICCAKITLKTKKISTTNHITPKVCVAGIGNSLRSDDGLGAEVCRNIEKLQIRGVSCFYYHQLQIELVEDFKDFDIVIIVDASLREVPVRLYSLREKEAAGTCSSHGVDALFIYRLSQQLYPGKQQYFVCEVQGHEFEMGTNLSAKGIANASIAIQRIKDFLYSIQINS